ncbi:hypothetical protein L596_014127 [Steinernema carpocapsae]|uniref:Uncharacterized protein n=1 Tax=Steinernema carpocapsae TaxID=34508 RepID=A0A4U5NAQ7_STECR|nr:hypothetical protein L596_014127 [Steinernema carpocapsae]
MFEECERSTHLTQNALRFNWQSIKAFNDKICFEIVMAALWFSLKLRRLKNECRRGLRDSTKVTLMHWKPIG